jgi:hypothetical protein
VHASFLAVDQRRILLFTFTLVSDNVAGRVLPFDVAVPEESAPSSAHDPAHPAIRAQTRPRQTAVKRLRRLETDLIQF